MLHMNFKISVFFLIPVKNSIDIFIRVVISHCFMLDGKILSLKITHTLITEYKEIKLVLTMRFSPCRIDFIGFKGSSQTARRIKKHQQSCTSENNVNDNNEKHSKICSWVQWWHKCYEINQPLSAYI